MSNTLFANWWTGLLVMIAIALLAVSFILQLHEWGIRPLRDVSKILNRSWFERLLLLFFVCGMVQYAATKGTGSGSRSSGTETRNDTVDEIEMTALRSGNSHESGEVTNLCFTGIAVLTNGVELNIAWPTNFFVLGTTLDFFAKYHSITNAWQWFAYFSTSPGMTNLTVVADWQTDLGCASNPPVLFFKVQDRATYAATMADADGDGLPDVYEINNGTKLPDGSNTILSVCSRSVDDRIRNIVPSNAVDRFVNFFENGSNHVFIANTNFWLKDVDVSCVSVWNASNDDPGSKTATAITRRHVVMANHWYNGTYYFCDTNGNCIVRRLSNRYLLPGSDMLLGRLDADLPASIHLPKVLYTNRVDSIANCKYLPSVCMNNHKAATILELDSLNCTVTASGGAIYHQMGRTSGGNVVSPERAAVWNATPVGNSSSPVFLLAGNELIFLFSKHLGYKSAGASAESWGPMLSYRLIEVQNKINEWEGSDAANYQINVIQNLNADD